MRVAVIDGQGGGLGKMIVEALRQAFGDGVRITALGTNTAATAAMMKAGADEGATGENPIIVNCPRVDAIIGAVGIISADSMLGELTPAMARAIGASNARKVLIPVNRCGLEVAGIKAQPLPAFVQDAMECLRRICQ